MFISVKCYLNESRGTHYKRDYHNFVTNGYVEHGDTVDVQCDRGFRNIMFLAQCEAGSFTPQLQPCKESKLEYMIYRSFLHSKFDFDINCVKAYVRFKLKVKPVLSFYNKVNVTIIHYPVTVFSGPMIIKQVAKIVT